MKQRPLPAFHIREGAKVFIHQAFSCCPYGGHISSKIHDFVELNGYSVVDEPEEAEIQIINTCGYNETRSQLAVDAIALVRELAPESALVVAGCLTRILPRVVDEAVAGVQRRAIIGPHRLTDLDVIFDHERTDFESTPTFMQKDRYSHLDPRDGLFQVQVSTGCLGKCSYCAIRRSMGRPRSLSVERVMADIRAGLAAGHRDFHLSSTDLSSYGADIGTDFVALMRAVSEIEEECLFTLESFDPGPFLPRLDELLPLVATKRFACLYLPLQSGSQRILDLMRRRYRVEDVLDAIDRLHEADPELLIATDMIYGFADESWDEFLLTIDAGRRYDYAKYNNYEPRPGTPPLILPPEAMVRRRAVVMEELQRQGDEIEAFTRRRIIPYNGPRSVEEDLLGRLPPSVRDFLTENERRFSRLIEKHHGLTLGPRWTLLTVEVDPRQRHLVLRGEGPEGATLTVALSHPSTGKRCYAASERFLLTHLADRDASGGAEVDASRNAAIALLAKTLKLKPVRGEAPPTPASTPAPAPASALHTFTEGVDRWGSDPPKSDPG